MTRRHLFTASLLLAGAMLTGCESNPVGESVRNAGNAVANSLSRATSGLSEDAALVVARRIYLGDTPEDTFIQRGYSIHEHRVKQYEPWCRFVVNLEIAGETANAVITRVEPDRFAIERMTTSRETTMRMPAKGDAPVQVASIALSTWLTRFKLRSDRHPWITALECGIFAGDDRPLKLEEVRKVLSPSVTIEN